MMRALWTGAVGMKAQQTNMDVIANNLANVNTTGFKKSLPSFQDLLYEQLRPAGLQETDDTRVPSGQQVGLGVTLSAIAKIFRQGSFLQTDNPLDLVIEGNGFFQVDIGDGEIAYTRDGSFRVDNEGRMVTTDGFVVQPAITVPEDTVRVNVSADGTVFGIDPAGDQVEIGQLELAQFINPAGLEALGSNLYRDTAASGEPQVGIPGAEGRGVLRSGYLEQSNVQAIEELVRMIQGQRAYEMNSKSIQTSDEMLQVVNNLKR